MTDITKENREENTTETELKDLPVDEGNADQVKGGPLVIDNGSGM